MSTLELEQEIGQMLDDNPFLEPDFDQMIDEIKGSEKAYGVQEIFVPGEIEFNHEAENLKDGIEIGPGVIRDLNALCDRYGIEMRPADYFMR